MSAVLVFPRHGNVWPVARDLDFRHRLLHPQWVGVIVYRLFLRVPMAGTAD